MTDSRKQGRGAVLPMNSRAENTPALYYVRMYSIATGNERLLSGAGPEMVAAFYGCENENGDDIRIELWHGYPGSFDYCQDRADRCLNLTYGKGLS